jgi:sporulation protein YlmC with PRC-barrel domain
VRLSDLLRLDVVDGDGESLGKVRDLSMQYRDGEWVTSAILVRGSGVTQRLGFIHGVVERPAPIARLMRRIGRHAVVVPWEQVDLTATGIRVDATRRDLKRSEGSR